MQYAVLLFAFAALPQAPCLPQAPGIETCQCEPKSDGRATHCECAPGTCGCGPDQTPCSAAKSGATKTLTYGEGFRQALKDGKPLVVFVGGLDSFNVAGCIICQAPYGMPDGTAGKRVVVARPRSDYPGLIQRLADLTPPVTEKDVLDVLAKPTAQTVPAVAQPRYFQSFAAPCVTGR